MARDTAVYTIGHSTRGLEEFIELLKEQGVETLVDVRSYPGSRRYPHFNKENLEQSIPEAGLGYSHMKALGGRRKRPKGEESPNRFWENAAFRHYADYAMTEDFRAGLEELEAMAAESTCAIMCAEAVWWRCHRRIITDYLLADGIRVCHIMGAGRVDEAEMTEGARPEGGERIVYDREEGGQKGFDFTK